MGAWDAFRTEWRGAPCPLRHGDPGLGRRGPQCYHQLLHYADLLGGDAGPASLEPAFQRLRPLPQIRDLVVRTRPTGHGPAGRRTRRALHLRPELVSAILTLAFPADVFGADA